ncbi:MAG: hypothetical protein A2233_02640 [Candidatus Kerfeldbacteria bacterium RIFOXYA2_FULL_38_24]|uniref:Uncharacterized protein n=1 Tax=Candidatus Kerfeldbacteria bacterium RIFOXYB2_FULL_38_14 TaxID=1798547 RepID=A0A1G2BGH7_9BACT|nr:MAG: hypothetical protein A2233_02640 [Candidatus Kerfeldbacteria bacterium RIFOXYA2_FULL_38_24]OGY88328.1 MAG: hypothetical protein A2319_03350 [Candidatus Kerfeldbacteria bacterium RIFOXYB2_FULL_38_14]OGY89315.1 MAG: hypothetical protein A2458_05175 [Candidatus Kerfeldbacteria bacterium RIFOXYC2_FULL_38_9]
MTNATVTTIHFVPGVASHKYFLLNYLYPLYAVLLLTTFASHFILLIIKIKKEKIAYRKNEFRYLLLALSFPVCFSLFTNLILPLIISYVYKGQADPSPLYNMGPSSTVFFSSITAYVILRHRLMDIQIILKRNAAVLIIPAITALILVLLIKLFIPQTTIINIALLFGFITAVFFYPIKKIIKQEYIDLYCYSAYEKKLLAKTESPRKFVKLLVSQCMRRLPVKNCEFIIYNHASGSFQTIYPENKHKKYSLDEPWIHFFSSNDEIFPIDNMSVHNLAEKTKKSLDKLFATTQGVIALPFKIDGRLLGMMMFSERIDGEKHNNKNINFLQNFEEDHVRLLWGILQMEYHVYTGMKNKMHLSDSFTFKP